MSMPAPATSTNDAAICVTANTRNRRFVPDVSRTLRPVRAHSVGGIGRRQPRHERQQHRGGDRESAADPEQARIDRDVVRAHREARRIERQHRDHRPRDRDRQHRAGRSRGARFRRAASAAAPPVPAPSAARIASSPSRRTERARIRFATFEHATMKTSPDAASSTSRIVRAGEMISSRRPFASMRKSACFS